MEGQEEEEEEEEELPLFTSLSLSRCLPSLYFPIPDTSMETFPADDVARDTEACEKEKEKEKERESERERRASRKTERKRERKEGYRRY